MLAVWEHSKHRKRLVKAAGVVRINLVCAPATWDEVRRRCTARYGQLHFPQEASASDVDGLVHVELEGPHLVRLLEETRWGTSAWSLSGVAGRAVFRRVYEAAADVVDEIDLTADQGKPIRDIVLDARRGPE
ncbi:hypothetical protein [Streptomyces sp. NPDC087856]|uniref:hypothetical protein n=1 Tax=Streptomyces sp. NPDC087856 TaxID=3365811 RepID=UPI0038031A61